MFKELKNLWRNWRKKQIANPQPLQQECNKQILNKLGFDEYKERIETLINEPEFGNVNIDVDKLSLSQIIIVKDEQVERKVFKDRNIGYIHTIISQRRDKASFMAIVKIEAEEGKSISLFSEYIILSDIDVNRLNTKWDVDMQDFTFITSNRNIVEILFTSGCCC